VGEEEVAENAAKGIEGDADGAVGQIVEAEGEALGVEEGEREGTVEAGVVEVAPVVLGPELGEVENAVGVEAGLQERAIIADGLVGQGDAVGENGGKNEDKKGKPAGNGQESEGDTFPILFTLANRRV
jgi:hypothetical protein